MQECGVIEEGKSPADESSDYYQQEVQELRVRIRNLEFDNKMLVSENSSLKLKVTRLEDTIRCA